MIHLVTANSRRDHYSYQLAEEHTTKALDMGLMTNPRTKAKALYRRSQARRYLGKFEEALDGEYPF